MSFVINGFHQSEKYFIKYEKEIREFFKIPNEVKQFIDHKYKNLFNGDKLTSIHVRRGDYLKLSHVHKVLPIEYYNEAINKLDSITDKFIVFSNDIEWCQTVFIGDKYIFIDNEKDYIELYLMSLCNNHVIANSSFSWWGAWLNPDKNKTVIAPKDWFSHNDLNTDDLIPDSWIKI